MPELPRRSDANRRSCYERGQRVRYTAGPLGALYAGEITVNAGDEGFYMRVHDLVEWHLTAIERDGVQYLVPVHASQFEAWDA